MELDSVYIGVSDLEAAADDYERLLGVSARRDADGTCRFQLGRGAVVLESGALGLHAVRFVSSDPAEVDRWSAAGDAFNGIDVRAGAPPDRVAAVEPGPGGVEAIDHVVIRTEDPERAIALWRDRLGVRLALDAQFPERGLRMCFFRSAGITLEFVSSLMPPAGRPGPDSFYGVAYQVGDLDAWRERLLAAGLEVSDVHRGQKRDTRVVTVRSGTAGVPTLLIANSRQ
jgi:catechol 2,3-dioxygenase-like lactoylglutathione lyase family enzyme